MSPTSTSPVFLDNYTPKDVVGARLPLQTKPSLFGNDFPAERLDMTLQELVAEIIDSVHSIEMHVTTDQLDVAQQMCAQLAMHNDSVFGSVVVDDHVLHESNVGRGVAGLRKLGGLFGGQRLAHHGFACELRVGADQSQLRLAPCLLQHLASLVTQLQWQRLLHLIRQSLTPLNQ